MGNRHVWLLLLLGVAQPYLSGQWAVYRDPSAPRARDGKVNLSAPAPRVNGKPDLSGIWEAESSPAAEIQQYLLPGGINGLGETLPTKYFFNFLSDFPAGQEPFQPAAKAAYEKTSQSGGKPPTLCPIPTLPIEALTPTPFKIVQTPRIMMVLYEDSNVFRQIFTDGRKLPSNPQPSWLGYSVGRWEGEVFTVETVGLNDLGILDTIGHPRSESIRLTERFHRQDFGHLQTDITVDDAKSYTKPITVHVGNRLLPDTELLESFCSENEKDLAHFLDK